MKKKILALALSTVLMVSMLAGCGSASKPSQTSASKGTDAQTKANVEETAQSMTKAVTESLGGSVSGKKVGITVPSIGNDFLLALTSAMQESLKEAGCEVQFDSAESNVTTQITQIENDITMGCNALVVWAVNGEGVSNACKKAVEQGIPVLAFANEIPGASCSMISASDSDMGIACAEIATDWINKAYPDAGDGEVKAFVMTASTIPEAVVRSDGILNKIKECSKVTVIEAEIADWNDTGAARTLAENTLLANPDINVIICANGASGVGTDSFVMSGGSPVQDKSKFAVFCVDETEEVIAKIKASVTDESVLRGTISLGSIGDTIGDFMKAISPILNDQEPEDVNGSAAKVTPETLK